MPNLMEINTSKFKLQQKQLANCFPDSLERTATLNSKYETKV